MADNVFFILSFSISFLPFLYLSQLVFPLLPFLSFFYFLYVLFTYIFMYFLQMFTFNESISKSHVITLFSSALRNSSLLNQSELQNQTAGFHFFLIQENKNTADKSNVFKLWFWGGNPFYCCCIAGKYGFI